MPLEQLDELLSAIIRAGLPDAQLRRLRAGQAEQEFGNVGMLYCPSCSEYSGMTLETLHFEKTVGQELVRELTREDTIGFSSRPKLPEYSDPSLFMLDCVNCANAFYALLYRSEDGPVVALFSTRGGGVATPKTPDLVKYYLEQAYKAQVATAYSASLAMYRAALEQLLEDKGFNGKLPAKLQELRKQIDEGNAPPWAKRVNADTWSVIKDICNSHVHPSELSKLKALDSAFMSKIQSTFSTLLKTAYEQEVRQAAAKAKLDAALKKAKQKNSNK